MFHNLIRYSQKTPILGTRKRNLFNLDLKQISNCTVQKKTNKKCENSFANDEK